MRVLKLLVVGRNGKEIAADLAVPPETVREHVQSILVKLQVHSRLEAAARSISSEAHSEGRLTQDPTCPRCSAMLEETLTARELEVGVGDEPRKVRIAYCGRCGSAVGLFA
jgi:DNA-binding CsgD family transcriptional regulator/ribosomal protein S27AE